GGGVAAQFLFADECQPLGLYRAADGLEQRAAQFDPLEHGHQVSGREEATSPAPLQKCGELTAWHPFRGEGCRPPLAHQTSSPLPASQGTNRPAAPRRSACSDNSSSAPTRSHATVGASSAARSGALRAAAS